MSFMKDGYGTLFTTHNGARPTYCGCPVTLSDGSRGYWDGSLIRKY